MEISTFLDSRIRFKLIRSKIHYIIAWVSCNVFSNGINIIEDGNITFFDSSYYQEIVFENLCTFGYDILGYLSFLVSSISYLI